jgi:mono-ADP-ribosyltransferase sirtuin 6
MVMQGMIEHVVAQNCDGLHRLSGIPSNQLSELHGNTFVEFCRNCGTEYERSFDAENHKASEYYEALENGSLRQSKKWRGVEMTEQCTECRLSHQTVRTSHVCPDFPSLNDAIINFGDSLRDNQIDPAIEHCRQADVIIVLGSTLQVTPAANLCRNKEQKLVICNRQTTQLDSRAAVRAFADCDAFVELL